MSCTHSWLRHLQHPAMSNMRPESPTASLPPPHSPKPTTPFPQDGREERTLYSVENSPLSHHGRVSSSRGVTGEGCQLSCLDEAPAWSPAKGRLPVCQPWDTAHALTLPSSPRLPTFFSPPLTPACGAPRLISLATSRNAWAGRRAVVLLPSSVRVSGFIVCSMQLSSGCPCNSCPLHGTREKLWGSITRHTWLPLERVFS